MRFLLLAAALMVASAASGQSLNAPPTAIQAALDHLQARGPAMGLRAADTEDLAVSSAHVSARTGGAYVYVQQRLDGIDVRGALVSVAVDAQGTVTNAAGELVGGLTAATTQKTASLSPEAALLQAARLVGVTPEIDDERRSSASADRKTSFGEINGDPVTARLVYMPTDRDGLRLAWEVVLPTSDSRHIWEVVVDAATGAELARHDRVVHDVFPSAAPAPQSFAPVATPEAGHAPLAALAHAISPVLGQQMASSYLVYPMPVEAPIYTSPAPPADARTAAVDPEDVTASPFGWHDTNGASGAEFTITRGNNVHAYQDRNNSNSSSGDEPDGGASLTFAPSLDLTQDPSAYQEAAVVNLFYWNNIIHDLMVHYGFDEASGNFQQTNYSGQGAGGDYVQAHAQDAALGTGNCNANMSTPTDGSRPRMQMYLCDNTNPETDGDFDNGVIVHEYGHGISIRLTGGAGTSSCLNNSEQMGEGWSDYFGMMMTMESGDARGDARGMGNYLFGQSPSGSGIRPAPYSTDFAVNNYTYGSTTGGLSVPHGIGFVWATALWEMTWDLVDAHGFSPDLYNATGSAGNQIALALVMEALKLQPCSPGFVDGRDAILQADADLYPDAANPGQGLHYTTLWGAFARRGLGFSANQGSSGSNSDNVEAFDSPLPAAASSITPGTVAASVAPGASTTATVTIANTAAAGSQSLSYSTFFQNVSQPLAPGVPVMKATPVTPEADGLRARAVAKGVEEAPGTGTVSSLAGGPDMFGYVFVDSDEPDGPAVDFQDISATGTAVTWTAASTYAAGDEGFADVALPFDFPFYGTDRSTVRVYTNGFLTFTSITGNTFTNGTIPASATPNALIAPFWDDLDASSAGTVYTGTLPDGRFVVQYDGVPRYSSSSPVTFQAILSDDGTIEVQYGSMTGTLNSATVGIENDSGTTGLQVVRNASYVASNKAIRFSQLLIWASASPASGAVAPGNSQDMTVTFDATDLTEGTYTADIVIATNDPAAPTTTIPVTLTVEDGPTGSGPIVFTAPGAGETLAAGTTYTVTWDPGGVDPGTTMKLNLKSPSQGNQTLASSVPNTGSYSWSIPSTQPSATDYRIVGVYTDPATGGKVRPKTNGFEISGGVAPPTPITITSPEAGDVLEAGTTVTVTWDPGDIDPSVLLQVRLIAAGYNVRLAKNEANDGSYSWAIPSDQAPGPAYKIQLVYTDPSTGAKVKPGSGLFEITASPTLAKAGAALSLSPAQPNPVQGTARVPFSLAEAGDVRLTVHDARGREVAVLASGRYEAGTHAATWASGAVAPGVYVVRLQAGAEVLTERAVVVR